MERMLRSCLRLVSVGLLMFFPAGAWAATTGASAPVVSPGVPLSFGENFGQYAGPARFVGSVPGATVEFAPEGVRYHLSRPLERVADRSKGLLGRRLEAPRVESLEITTRLIGADPTAPISGEDLQAHLSHFYFGNDPARWRTDVPNYGAVRYRGVYPGIDLAYHGNGRQLEYDFILSPGTDPECIRVGYDGIEGLAVTEHGDLEVATRFGRVIERAPVAYQTIRGERRPVGARYRVIDSRTFGFVIEAPYDRTAELVIDPILTYSTYVGGAIHDEDHGIVYDAAGNAYVTGGTFSPDFPATGSPVPGANYSAFVTKLTPDLSAISYSVFLGGSEHQIAYGIDIDASTNVYIVGNTSSNDFPTTPGCYDPSFNGPAVSGLDIFVAKLSPTGTLLYSTYLGSSGTETGSGIALRPTGEVFVLGIAGPGYPTTVNAYDTSTNGFGDVVLTEMTLAGTGSADLLYSTFLGGNNYDEAYDVASDVQGYAYISGSTSSNNFPATGGPPFNTTFDAFVAKIKPLAGGASDLAYAVKFGGVGQDYGTCVAVNALGDPHLAGLTASANFPAVSYQNTYGGGTYDAFALKLLSNGSTLVYNTFLGGTGEDRAWQVALDPNGNAVVAGSTESAGFPTTAGAYDVTYNGGGDIFISVLDPYGTTLIESTFLGGTYREVPYGLAVDPSGRWYVAGTTESTDYPTTLAAYDNSFNGGPIDVIVAKFAGADVCEACVPAPDTCCAARPTLHLAEAPSFSSNVLVTTREPTIAYPYCVTIFDLGSPPPTPLEDQEWGTVLRFNGPLNTWDEDTLGTVFGLTLDKFGNIFVTHTSCYMLDKIAQVFNGGPGAIYRIDAATGVVTTFCRLPNYPDVNLPPGENLPGLGNISYDCRNDQFFVTDLEDGRIYRIKANGVNGPTGTIQEVFDPFTADLGPLNYQSTTPTPGWAAPGELLWGVQWHANRVYYGVWVEHLNAPNAAAAQEIRSVALNGSGAFVPTSDQHEISLPALNQQIYSMPVSDISFSAAGRMLVGERSMQDVTTSVAHLSRVLEYICVAGCWVQVNTFAVGQFTPTNSAGGVDYDRFPFTGGVLGRAWASGDLLHAGSPYPDVVYGFQGFRPNGGSILTSMLIDGDASVNSGDKFSLGDIEAPGCPNSALGGACGQKFLDLDHDGVKDNGEPGLAGWTIVLNGPGGPYTGVTDGNGNYCFSNLPPGNYTLGEVGQASWLQTMPPTGSYAFTLAAGQTVTGNDFGNYSCVSPASGCVMPPPGMGAWWPFNETSGATAADVTHLVPSRNVAQLFGGAAFNASGQVGGALCFGSELDYAKVPNSNQLGINFAANSFAIDTWVKVGPGGSPRIIAEKRVLVSPSPYRTRGWALYLNGLQSQLEIGIGIATQTVPGPTVTANLWNHLAVSIDRSSGTGRWYLNGAPQPAFNFVPITGAVFSNADLYMGQASPPFGIGFLEGCIDELELFTAPLPAQTVQALYNAGVAGKCPEYCRLPQITTICKNAASVQVCFNICNNKPTPQSYHWSLAGLPAGTCSVNGPVTFTPAAGTVTVLPGTCSAPICVTIPRPAGLNTPNATACYALNVVNDATGECHTCEGRIRADYSCWCATPVQNGIVGIPARFGPGQFGVPIEIGLGHPCDVAEVLSYRLSAVYTPHDHPDPLAVSLNGLPPGEPVFGTLVYGPNESGLLSVLASYPNGYDPAGLYEILLEADTDGDGMMEPVCGTRIASEVDTVETTDAPDGPRIEDSVVLRAAPNPFQNGSTIAFALARPDHVELGIYDLSGRLVRTLQRGRIKAGSHRFEWNGRDGRGHELPAGMYFVRLRSERLGLEAKVVKLR